MPRQILSNLDFGGNTRIVNLPDPAAAQEPATKGYVDATIEGLNWKTNCLVATQANVSIAAPGATVDGVTPVSGQSRVLVRAQTLPAENGIYIWNGAAAPMTRAADMNLSGEFTNAIATVSSGTSAGSSFRQTAVAPTVGTTAIAWVSFGTAASAASTVSAGIVRLATQAEVDAGTDALTAVAPSTLAAAANRKLKFSANFGDGSATQYDIVHSLGTLDVHVAVFRNSGSGDEISCDVSHLNTTTVRLNFGVAPTSNQYRCVVIG